ncbi:MAG: SprT-like domain-containing protein [Actinomycetaceae bacterium]|nr:SprT-like domain-containing protein [Actinomycetaceae bacterium]MDU0970742.1 SprT-like domain-containing protein [Actinomycetaceae bacterium]
MELDDVRRAADALIDQYGLAQQGWRVQFDRATRRAGCCRFDRQVISLSAPLMRLYDADQVRDVVLHEVAHALAGPRHGHDQTWRRIAQRVGANPRSRVPKDAPRVSGPWVGTCPAGHTIDRFRRPRRVLTCAVCSPRFDMANVFTWTYEGVPTAPGGDYARQLRRLRAKTP